MRLLTLLLVVSPLFTVAQKVKTTKLQRNPAAACSLPGMLPESAIPVCGSTVFRQTNVTSCTGTPVSGTGACNSTNSSDNAFWYKFHCYQAGTLGFLIKPVIITDDFDWEIFDVTGVADLNQLYTDESLMVSLNLFGNSTNGATGCTAAGIDSINCGGTTNIVNRLATLHAGHDYLLMVNNWTNSGQGYTLSFFGGTANITENNPPLITNVATTCNTSQIKVTFSKDVMCNSVTGTGSEFTITSGTNTVTSVSSNCNLGFSASTELTLNLQSPLTPGNYFLNVNNGTDGDTFADACGTATPQGTQIPFTVTAYNAAEVDTITYVGCAPTVLDVKLTKPVFCSSVTYTGSEFTIQPGNIVITSVQGDCTGAIPSASILHINLQNPLPYGNYQLFIQNGSDGDTFIDTCTNNVAGNMIPFVINQTTVAPLVQSVSFDECHPDKVVVNFDKPVLCTSISSPANEFAISPGVWPITNVNYNCNGAGNTTSQVTLTLQNPLPAGNFNVAVGAGNDGNTLADTCYAFMANGYTKAFVTTKAPAPKFDSVQFDKCNPAFVKLFYSKPIKCASVSADGSDYTITGPSAVNITAAVTDANCATAAYTNWVMLQFAQPVNVSGNYVVHNKAGIDGNGIIDTCSAAQNIAETIAFDALIKPSATFASLVKFGCKMDTITLSHPGGNGINSWLWTFSDGSTATGQTVTKTFPVSTVTTTVQLKVDNGFCNDVVTKDITLDNAFSATFVINPKDTSCINTPIAFTNTSTGKNLQYLWQFGDNTQFTGQTPPPHVYTASSAYNIKLLVTDPYGCTDVATTVLHIAALPTIDFTGLAAQYCTDKTIALTRTISNNIFAYTWNNGDGVTITSQPRVQFSYPKEGVYTITLSGTDKYCGTTQASKTVNIFAVPKFNLGNDTVLCPAVSLPIGVPFTNGYSYLWNTGATTSQISTDILTANYSLLIDNNGCKAMDDISVKVLVACLIKVPNAFTPNSDGKNDVLRPTSADLAREFTFKVYNRFGELMFATSNPLEGWNGYYKGVRATAGTYVWQLAYIDPWSNKKIFESGTSILIR